MARTPLAGALQAVVSALGEAVRRGVTAEQVQEERAGRGLTRRELLERAAAVGMAGAMPFLRRSGMVRAGAGDPMAPRIAVVGAGLAGLTCAYRLKQEGLAATVYEASSRVGGRCYSHRGYFDQGQIAEHGGELIDTGHTQVRQLAQELGLDLDNLCRAEQNGTEPLYFIGGEPYTVARATDDLKAIWQKLHGDLSAAGYPTLYNRYTQRGWELDHLSIIDWINESVPGGSGSRLGQLLDVAYNIEYGGECAQQSALNLLYLLGYAGPGKLRLFGPSNEKYHVRGGNDQIASRLAALLEGQVRTAMRLAAIRLNGNGTYTLTFDSGIVSEDVVADRVVLAFPFSMLRSSVDYSRAGFSPVKQTAIAELAMGTNTKLNVQFTGRHWQSLGCNGETYADTGYQNTWEVTRGQPGTAGILVNYTGGNVGASFSSGTPAARAAQFLGQIEPVLPGLAARWNGKAHIDYWTGYRWTRGSYAYWQVGQYTRFAGAEGERSGNCHFAGEHTSVDFQGYLNGAVESGERAAGEILADLKQVRQG
jgi:monoamine oxidase